MSNQHALHLEWHTLEQAGASIRAAFLPYVEKNLRDGLHLAVTVQELEDSRSIQQNRYYWSVVLKEISEQATLNEIGATEDGWHLFFKRKVLGYKFTKTQLPGKKRPSVIKELRSTTKISVKKMSLYLEEVTAFAVTDLHVMFSVPKWQEYRE